VVVQLCEEVSNPPRLAALRCDLDADHKGSHFDRVYQVYWVTSDRGVA